MSRPDVPSVQLCILMVAAAGQVPSEGEGDGGPFLAGVLHSNCRSRQLVLPLFAAAGSFNATRGSGADAGDQKGVPA